MNVLLLPEQLLMPMWAVKTSLFIMMLVNARAEPHPPALHLSISRPFIHSQVMHFSQFSQDMEAQSPGVAGVMVVHHQDLNHKILIALIVASTLLAGILAALIVFWIYRHKNKNDLDKKSRTASGGARGLQLNPSNASVLVGKKGSLAVFEYQLLEAATNNFHEGNLLGEGDWGQLYRACFDEKLHAVVKRLDASDAQDAERQFEVEANWLGKIHHQNVITLLGCCIHGDMRFLLYETMSNGSLETQLHGPTNGSALSWHLRMKIAVDVARGLEFLHERCNPTIVHRNLKSSSILLDADFNAKISNFGLATTSGSQNKNGVKIVGPLDCLAPEYLLDGKLTDKSDVYYFGIILLELLMGRNPAEKITTTQSQSLVTWATPQLTDRSKLPNIVDPVIKDSMDLKHLYQVAAVAVLCIQPEPSYRPLITDVLHSLIPLLPIDFGGSLRIPDPASAV